MITLNSPSQILSDVSSQISHVSPSDIPKIEEDAAKLRKKLENDHFQQYIDLQREWSQKIGTILTISTLSIWILLFFVGLGWLNFQSYPWLLHTVVGTFFAQVVGLSLVVAKYLFASKQG